MIRFEAEDQILLTALPIFLAGSNPLLYSVHPSQCWVSHRLYSQHSCGSGSETELRAAFRDLVIVPGGQGTAVGVEAAPQCLLISHWAKQPMLTGWCLSFSLLLSCSPLSNLLLLSFCLPLAVPSWELDLGSSFHEMAKEA